MKNWFSRYSYLFCGLGQMLNGKPFRGFLLSFAFLDCFLIGIYFLLSVRTSIGLMVGLLCELLASLLWFYSYLDYLELSQSVPKLKKKKEEKIEQSEISLIKDEEAPTANEEENDEEEEEEAPDSYELGRIAYLRKEFQNAKKNFEKALHENAEDLDALYQLARIHYDLGDHPKAHKLFERYSTSKGSKKWLAETSEYLQLIQKN